MLSLYMEAGADSGQRDIARTMQNRKDKLDAAIEVYRKISCLREDSDPLSFWRGYDVTPLYLAQHWSCYSRWQLPANAAISATDAICEQRFKAGGQVLTSALLGLIGSLLKSEAS